VTEERTKYLYFRCGKCGRGITCYQLVASWEKAEQSDRPAALQVCSCGSRQLSPSNPKWYEELLYPSVWKLWYKRVFLPWWAAKRNK
jgi:hypothetical protein